MVSVGRGVGAAAAGCVVVVLRLPKGALQHASTPHRHVPPGHMSSAADMSL